MMKKLLAALTEYSRVTKLYGSLQPQHRKIEQSNLDRAEIEFRSALNNVIDRRIEELMKERKQQQKK